MLKKYLDLSRPRLRVTLQRFATALQSGRFSIKRDFSFIFLCGANRAEMVPSERRRYLKRSIENALPHARIVYAERVMDELAKHGKTKNLLDIECQISRIADWILIVLESYSSFCELGAFAAESLRSKLIVVNDKNYESQKSFINLGPLQAIKEDIAEDRVIWYPMLADGITVRDGIGLTLSPILKHLGHRHVRASLDVEACLPSVESQASLFFLHDIIYLCGPITHAETIEIYKLLFGDQPFDEIKSLRAILHAAEFITTIDAGKEHAYLAATPETFINFDSIGKDLIPAFRRFHLKYNGDRLIHV
ncbi:retron St85 family effector protein [Burkholderia pseudomallei]|uniref:retron St85 family effector protein n=1 Tax=Burkholderia pseudomallei TaxID=28450 RepID=UPI000AB7F97B|nr:retron St85 family effector protein [Burkholderia pseudomallei]